LQPEPENQPRSPRPARRPRYFGTHPTQYADRYKELDPNAYPDTKEHVLSQGRTPAGSHVPVLVNEVVSCLRPAAGETVADCTIGYGGHAAELLRHISPGGRLIGFDVDGVELERTGLRLAEAGWAECVTLHRGNFAGIAKALGPTGIEGYDIVFADLGVSSMQVDDPSRGLSYKNDGPLDMRLDDRLNKTAADLVATLGVEELSEAFFTLADEPDHERIAQEIVRRQANEPLRRTSQLVRLIFEAKRISYRAWKKDASARSGLLHPAARVFQALRMLVNDELGSLQQLLRIAPYCLRPGGRIGVISFHSGEDRLVKHSFRDGVAIGAYEAASEDVIRPTSEEVRSNPRSSAAKFRWAGKSWR